MIRLPALILGGLLGLMGVLVSLAPWLSDLEQGFGLAWLFQARGDRPPPQDAVVVAIDRESSIQLGLPEKPRDWPRSVHARMIDKLTKAGASVIALDITFSSANTDRAEDEALARAMRDAGNVVTVGLLRNADFRRSGDTSSPSAGLSIEAVIPPIPAIEQAAAAYAPFPLPKAARVDGFWAFKDSAGEAPSLPAAALQIHARCSYQALSALLDSTDAQSSRSFAGAGGRIAPGTLVETMRTLRSMLAGDPERAAALHDGVHPKGGTLDCATLPAVVHLYAGPEAYFLDYYGPPRTIRTLSYHQALDAEDAEFAGKAVFVGYSGATVGDQDAVRDDYQTVFTRADGLDLSGVEIAGTAFLNLLEERSVRPLATSTSLGLIFVWGVVIATAACQRRLRGAAMLTAGVSVSYLLIAQQAFAMEGIWLPLVLPLAIQTPLALFGGVWLRYRSVRRERDAIAQAFGHFLPKSAVERLARHVGPITSANQTLFGVCLASDAEQYTKLAEGMEPARLGQLMNEYFATLFAPVEKHGGIVSDVVGDAMVAIWAGSSADKALRIKACRAALAIAEAARNFGRHGDLPAMPTRIGLHAGQMMLGTVGAGSHFEYRAVGNMVNTATRIEGLGKHLGVRLLVSAEVLEGLDGFLARPLGVFLLHGKSVPVLVHELLAEREHATPMQSDMAARFSAALDAYRRQAWDEAIALFLRILENHPEDGPSRLYLDRCRTYASNPPLTSWDPVIRVEGK